MKAIVLTEVAGYRFSASAINQYLRCPRKFYYSTLLRLTQPYSTTASFGTIIHDSLEILHNWAGAQPIRPVYEEANAQSQLILEEVWQEAGKRFIYPAVQKAYRQKAQRLLKRYTQVEFQRIGADIPIRTTSEISFEQGFLLGRFPISGRIDRVDYFGSGEVAIIDYKTGSGEKAQNALIKDFINLAQKSTWQPTDYQLPLYYFYWSAVIGTPPRYIGHYQLKHSKGPRLTLIEIRPGAPTPEERLKGNRKYLYQEEMEEILPALLQVLEEMAEANQNFPAHPSTGRECQMCPYTFACEGAGEEEGEEE
ncbi:PD-(D/E)XK nuclease family protein [Candidatus Chlorohelix sp.]|uniref:RecB family exonuclease n=1 Tax=Candidatus Chlorohelix sp. TaxID=3139201 RepID=UPI00303A21CE